MAVVLRLELVVEQPIPRAVLGERVDERVVVGLRARRRRRARDGRCTRRVSLRAAQSPAVAGRRARARTYVLRPALIHLDLAAVDAEYHVLVRALQLHLVELLDAVVLHGAPGRLRSIARDSGTRAAARQRRVTHALESCPSGRPPRARSGRPALPARLRAVSRITAPRPAPARPANARAADVAPRRGASTPPRARRPPSLPRREAGRCAAQFPASVSPRLRGPRSRARARLRTIFAPASPPSPRSLALDHHHHHPLADSMAMRRRGRSDPARAMLAMQLRGVGVGVGDGVGDGVGVGLAQQQQQQQQQHCRGALGSGGERRWFKTGRPSRGAKAATGRRLGVRSCAR